MSKNIEQWLQGKKHLPEFMRDFHDQKELFKTIQMRISPEPNVNWIDAQIYTVDCFLHFMARRGYTLQKSRADVNFRDIETDIKETIDEQNDNFASIIIGAMKNNQ